MLTNLLARLVTPCQTLLFQDRIANYGIKAPALIGFQSALASSLAGRCPAQSSITARFDHSYSYFHRRSVISRVKRFSCVS